MTLKPPLACGGVLHVMIWHTLYTLKYIKELYVPKNFLNATPTVLHIMDEENKDPDDDDKLTLTEQCAHGLVPFILTSLWGRSIIHLDLQIKNLSLIEIQWYKQGYRARKWQSKDSNLGL